MNALDPRDVQALGFSLLHFVWQGMLADLGYPRLEVPKLLALRA